MPNVYGSATPMRDISGKICAPIAIFGRVNMVPSRRINEVPYLSLSRLGAYLYEVTFDSIPEFNGGDDVIPSGCSSYVKNGKLYRNLDWDYSELASFHVKCSGFEGMAFSAGLTDAELDDAVIGQLPYRLVDGCNDYGIRVSTHVLYNDWDWQGNGITPLYAFPYIILSSIKTLDNLGTQLEDILGDLYATQTLIDADYLLQFIVTDGTTTYCIMPPTSSSGAYVVQDITSNPKLANFRWVSSQTVQRGDLQTRPTGVERWNMMPCDLSELRFTKCYESPTRLSEFIGIRDTDKDSPDAELEGIYNDARALYLTRERDGSTWQTMHSIVYGANGAEHLWVQENWNKDYIASTGSGVYIGDEEPTDPDVAVWIRPSGEAGINANIMTYRPYWRVLDSIGFINAFALEDYTSDTKPHIVEIRDNGTAYSEELYAAYPCPMQTAVMTGSTDRKYILTSVNGSGVGARYRLQSPSETVPNAAMPAYVRLHLMGLRADVPTTPTITPDTSGAAEAATAIAQSYVDADIPFVYGANWTYVSAASQKLIAPSTRVKIGGEFMWGGRMECDAFVGMIMRGISYDDSPYAAFKANVESQTEKLFGFENIADYENPDSMTWVSWLLANGKLYSNPYMAGSHGGAVRWAQDIAWFMWSINDGEHCCIFSDKTKAANGDIAFFKKADREVFDNISHVAYIGEDDGELYIYEVTTESANHPNAVYKTKLADYPREIAYFARLNYSAMHT